MILTEKDLAMYSLTSNKTLFAKGVIGCNISIPPTHSPQSQ
ncbi:hypothetical protein C4J93_4074 [Pseudomonas sp. R2-37-08W]|nr:hypothetical protein C4J93_4074 [Pseudomonas sp. R2-37-08W]